MSTFYPSNSVTDKSKKSDHFATEHTASYWKNLDFLVWGFKLNLDGNTCNGFLLKSWQIVNDHYSLQQPNEKTIYVEKHQGDV